MGRQINFLLSVEDQRQLLTLLTQKFDLGGYEEPSDPSQHWDNPASYADPPNALVDGPYLFRITDRGHLKFRKHPLPGRGYCIDQIYSPAIEFWRPMIKDGSMVPGRFYYVTGYFEESGWRQMPHDFIKFAEALFRATKKFCVKERWTEHLGEYIGPDAAKLHKEGLKFVPFFT